MKQELTRQVASILEQSPLEVELCLVGGLHGISQNTWRKISERMELSDPENARFLLRVASVEFRLADGCVLSGAEVRQLLNLCGGFVPLYALSPAS